MEQAKKLENRKRILTVLVIEAGVMLELAKRGALVPQELPYSELQGILLKHLRLVQDMSQEGLAEKSGVSTATIVNLEGGKHRAQRSTIKALAAALGVSEKLLDPSDALVETPGYLVEGAVKELRDRMVDRMYDHQDFRLEIDKDWPLEEWEKAGAG